MWAAVAALLDSVESAAAVVAAVVERVGLVPVVLLPVVPVVPVPVPHEPEPPALARPVLARVRERRAAVPARVLPEPVPAEAVLLPHLKLLPLPQVVVESEVTLHLQGRQSFSAAMARSSPPTAQRTYER